MQLNTIKRAALPLACALVAGAACAENNVSFYGRANVSVESQKLGGTTNTVLVDNASRFGIRASHDLPDNMSVGMVLEAGTNLTNGATKSEGVALNNADGTIAGLSSSGGGSRLFAREASVALNGGFGQIKLGRMPASVAYFATADFVSNHNHDTGTSSDALYDFLATGQLSNAIGYASPEINGIKFEGQYGLKKGQGTGTTDSAVVNPAALALNYGKGPLMLGLGYERAQNPVLAASNASTTEAASQVAARVFYTMGALGFGGYIQKSSGTQFDRSAYRLSAMYTVGKNEFHLNVGAAGNRNSVANTGAKQATLGYNFNLDKQTKLYAFYTKINQDSATKAYAGGAQGDAFSSLGMGIRYNF